MSNRRKLIAMGDSVVIISGPWKKEIGSFIGYEKTPLGNWPKIRLNNGIEILTGIGTFKHTSKEIK